MQKMLAFILLLVGCTYGQSNAPAISNDATRHTAPDSGDDLFPVHRPTGQVGLVRGVLKRVDPVYDQLVIRPFGGRDVRVAFNLSTQFFPEKAELSPAIAVGSIVSIDTVMDEGKVYALAVRTGAPGLAELNGEVVGVDGTRSRLQLRSFASQEPVSLRITSTTAVTDRGQASSFQRLVPGSLVRVWFSAGENAVHQVEVLAKPGSSFTFEGKIIAVDLRLRTLLLLNDTDQSLRDLAFASLDGKYLGLLREGSNVAIEAEFDGNQYNVRSVTLLPHTP